MVSLVVAAAFVVLPASLSAATSGPSVDFDGDGASDVAVWRPSTTTWFVRGGATMQLGASGDLPVPADYDGDGKSEFAVWRPSSGMWLISGRSPVQWGVAGDVPVPGDFDGNGAAEIAVWRPSNGVWYVRGGATTQWGVSSDVPVPADYDGDRRNDVAVWRPSTGVWWIRGAAAVQWGVPSDLPVTGDYDGDGKSDIAVWRPSTGTWFVRAIAATQWGISSDVPVPADYDGDGRTDVAVWRPSTGIWYVLGNSPLQWGVPTDVPLSENGARAAAGPPPDTSAPTVPGNLRATSTGQTSITLAWDPSSDNVGVSGYGRYRNGTLLGTGTGTSFSFTGLTCGTGYTLAIDATDQAGNRSAKATLNASTSACTPADTQPPSVPQGLHTASKTQTSVTLAWNASTDNVGVVGYHMYRDNFRVASTPNLTYTFTGLACGTLYALALEAYDAAGNVSYRPEAVAMVTTNACNADDEAPTAPTGLTTSGITSSSITLTWTASSDNVAVSGYGRYANSTLVGSGTGTTYTFTNLACNTAHVLGIDAYDAAGNRSARATVNATTSTCPPEGSATVFMSPSGSDSSPCTQAQPCRTFNRAYRVAAPGTIVQVAGGSYGGETIGVDTSKTSPNDVLFRPAPGATVNVTGSLNFTGAHIEIRDMIVHEANFSPSADDITFRNIVNHGMWWQASSNISIIGGEITCPTCAYHPHMQNGGSPLRAPTNILFDGVYFHDWHSQAGEHVECLQILGADNVTIRNSTFKNCGTANGGRGATAALHLQAYGTGPLPKNILLENNFFYASGNMFVIQGEDMENFDLRYNSIAGPILIYNTASPGTGMDFIGNIMRAGSCTAQGSTVPINWRHNIIQGGTCGSTDRNAPYGFIDVNNNLHLAPGAAALNAGDPASFPARDFDGQTRPQGSAPDAGADEAG